MGESFSAILGASGEFKLRYVPRGAYTLRVSIPGQPEDARAVTVFKRRVPDVGGISICGDNDGDGFTPDVLDLVTGNDCNDNNALIFPGATEFCDGVDNDCDDSDNTVRQNGAEICDGVENNCDGSI